MTAAPSAFATGRFDLPLPERRALLVRQAGWALVQTAATAGMVGLGLQADAPITAGVATGLGLLVACTHTPHLLPFYLLATAAGTLAADWFGVAPWAGAAMVAGILVGKSGFLGRFEGALAGISGAAVGTWVAWHLAPDTTSLLGAIAAGGLGGLGASLSLLPGALRFSPINSCPSPARVRATLAEGYRAPVYRAWQLEQELVRQAPDRDSQEGIGEVAFWVYRLGLTLQTLDQDVARLDPDTVNTRRHELLYKMEHADDSFVRDRYNGTLQHLDRMLEHRVQLVRERERTASLQEYAVAYLEEARAGLAVARLLPGEETPEQLGKVLEKLRSHAAEGGARRQAARELEALRA